MYYLLNHSILKPLMVFKGSPSEVLEDRCTVSHQMALRHRILFLTNRMKLEYSKVSTVGKDWMHSRMSYKVSSFVGLLSSLSREVVGEAGVIFAGHVR